MGRKSKKLTKKRRRKTHWDETLKVFRVGPRAGTATSGGVGSGVGLSKMVDLFRESRDRKRQKRRGLI